MNNRKEIFYISNLISLSRFLLTGITVILLLSSFKEKYLYSVGMILIIGISDLLDGYFARKKNEISELGKIIDPLADKVCIISIALILLTQNVIPIWFVLIIVLRDVIIFSGGMYLKYKEKVVLMSNRIGKISVFIIGLTLLFSIFFMHFKYNQIFFSYHTENLELYLKFLIILSIAMSIVSLIVYIFRFTGIVFKKNI